MKIAFSTLACPKWSFNEIFSAAKDLGYNGIEIRGVGNEIYAPKIKEFDKEHINDTLNKLEKAGIEISILSSAAELAKPGNSENAEKEVKEYIDTASKLGVPYVRVLCTQSIDKEDCDIAKGLEVYNCLCEYGKKKKVTPLIETNGALCDSFVAKSFMENCKSKNKGILWDVHHPFRFNNETISFTLDNIGEYVKYVHIKDSVYKNEKLVYTLLGKGDVPLKEAIKALSNLKYKGYLSLEWLKRWLNDLEEPGIVLSHFQNEIKNLL